MLTNTYRGLSFKFECKVDINVRKLRSNLTYSKQASQENQTVTNFAVYDKEGHFGI